MSLRDDLNILDDDYLWGVMENKHKLALDRLCAVLTPAAEKWLEALPELLRVAAKATPGPWVYEHRKGGSKLAIDSWGRVGFWQKNERAFVLGMGSGWSAEFDEPSSQDANLILALRNALHEAAALHNATNEKEQK